MSVNNGAPAGAPRDENENSSASQNGDQSQFSPVVIDGGKNVATAEGQISVSEKQAQHGGAGQKRVFEKFEYKRSDEGPYRVVVLKEEENDAKREEDRGGLNKIAVGKVLSQNGFMKSVLDVKKVGRNKVIVYLSDWKEANRMCSCQNFSLRRLKAFISKEFVTVKGVIGGIPQEHTEKELAEDLVTEKEIIEVFRMHRLEKGKRIPISKVGVVFRSSQLPKVVRLYGVNLRVEPYIMKTVMCNKCLRFGHVAIFCKGRQRCANCGESHEGEEDCRKETVCVHCKGSHKATEEKCPEREKQKNIKRMMASKNLTYQEAKEEFRVATKNGFSILAEESEFPSVYESYAQAAKQKVQQTNPGRPNEWTSNRKQVVRKNKVDQMPEAIDSVAGITPNREDETLKSKKRRATSQLRTTSDEITMEQHLELRKRWEDKLKELVKQKDSYKAVMSKSFQKLGDMLSSNDSTGAYAMLVDMYKTLGQILGLRVDKEITGDMMEDEEFSDSAE